MQGLSLNLSIKPLLPDLSGIDPQTIRSNPLEDNICAACVKEQGSFVNPKARWAVDSPSQSSASSGSGLETDRLLQNTVNGMVHYRVKNAVDISSGCLVYNRP